MARSFGKIIWKGLTTKRWLSPTKSALRRAGAKADHKRQKKVRQKPGFFAFVCGFFGFFYVSLLLLLLQVLMMLQPLLKLLLLLNLLLLLLILLMLLKLLLLLLLLLKLRLY